MASAWAGPSASCAARLARGGHAGWSPFFKPKRSASAIIRALDLAAGNAHLGILIRVARPFMKAPAQGAPTPIYLASSPEVEGVTGQYLADRKPKTSSKASYDTAAAARLWQASTALAGLTAAA
jgi:hypothetical protein